jgi:hypothetical protein
MGRLPSYPSSYPTEVFLGYRTQTGFDAYLDPVKAAQRTFVYLWNGSSYQSIGVQTYVGAGLATGDSYVLVRIRRTDGLMH